MRRVQSLTLFLGLFVAGGIRPTIKRARWQPARIAAMASPPYGRGAEGPSGRRSIEPKIHRAEDSSRRWTGALKEGRKTWLIWNYPSRVPRQRT